MVSIRQAVPEGIRFIRCNTASAVCVVNVEVQLAFMFDGIIYACQNRVKATLTIS